MPKAGSPEDYIGITVLLATGQGRVVLQDRSGKVQKTMASVHDTVPGGKETPQLMHKQAHVVRQKLH